MIDAVDDYKLCELYRCTPSQLDHEDYAVTQLHLGIQKAFADKEEKDAKKQAAKAKRKNHGYE